MAKPIVVIVGRPNVGKSTLFNRMTRTNAAIVESIPGVTRDTNYLDTEWEGKKFIVVDTGGFYVAPPENIFMQVKEHAMFAIEEGDIVIHLLDGKDGLTPSDKELAKMLRASGKNILWVVNKIDSPKHEDKLLDFYELGTDTLFPLSAITGYGYSDFMDNLVSFLPHTIEQKLDYPKIAVVGRPNVGKSTLVNTLLGKKRMIVTPVPGTTRDAVDSICTYYKRKYLLIDTAGIKRKDKFGYSLERFSMIRALRSIERCDIALIVLDAGDGIVEQDQKIAGIVERYGKSALFLLNKWDIIKSPEDMYKTLTLELKRKMWFMQYAPVLTISATEKTRVTKIFHIIDEIMGERRKRIPTAELNRYFREINASLSLPHFKGRPVKLYYITQIKTEPPSFTVFTNYPAAISESHIRFMEKVLRNNFLFSGTPVRIYIKGREKEKRG
ncbi:MAG: ribosome biogenesis GTPase Der [Nitrospirae bacterium]|nr:ribosome biogenesis GTPase Der [Nitrospirota bacterium]